MGVVEFSALRFARKISSGVGFWLNYEGGNHTIRRSRSALPHGGRGSSQKVLGCERGDPSWGKGKGLKFLRVAFLGRRMGE